MPKHIPPTVGRKVWLFIDSSAERPRWAADVHVFDGQPLDASIAFVGQRKGDYEYLNLSFADHSGIMRSAIGIPLRQDGQRMPDARAWCEWMPFQVKQAATLALPVSTEEANVSDRPRTDLSSDADDDAPAEDKEAAARRRAAGIEQLNQPEREAYTAPHGDTLG